MTDVRTRPSLEMARSFSIEPDRGKNLEVAFAAVVFRNLQRAGLIPDNAKMPDKPPQSAEGFKGTSYEARLVELIRDEDGDGRLDLSYDRLRSAGLLSESPSNARLDRVLAAKPVNPLSNEFFRGQDRRSELTYLGVPNERGQQVREYSKEMVLRTESQQTSWDFLEDLGARMKAKKTTPLQGAQEILEHAKTLEPPEARELLLNVGSALMKLGHHEAARTLFQALKAPKHKDEKVHLMQHVIDQAQRQIEGFEPRKGVSTTIDGVKTEIDVRSKRFQSTFGEVADQRLAQMALSERMSRALHRPVALDEVASVAEYFQTFARGKSIEAVRAEFEKYLKTEFKHSQGGVEWGSVLDRPGFDRITQQLGKQPRTLSGQVCIDCEGFAELTKKVLGGITDDRGHPRFQVLFGTRPDHIISGVFEPRTHRGFSVDNDQTTVAPGKLENPRQKMEFMAKDLAEHEGRAPDVMRFGGTHEDTKVFEGRSLHPDVWIWDGQKLRGQADQAFLDGFREFQAQTLFRSPNAYLVEKYLEKNKGE